MIEKHLSQSCKYMSKHPEPVMQWATQLTNYKYEQLAASWDNSQLKAQTQLQLKLPEEQ